MFALKSIVGKYKYCVGPFSFTHVVIAPLDIIAHISEME